MVFKILGRCALIFLRNQIGRQQIDNTAAVYNQCVVFIGYGFRFNGYNPAGMNEGIDDHELFLCVGYAELTQAKTRIMLKL